MKTIAILDTETTGLDPAKDDVLEVAVCIYDLASASAVRSYASLLRASENRAFDVNGIPVAALERAPEPTLVWAGVETLLRSADTVVAHRADFDRSFVEPHLTARVPWVCSKFDLRWPRGKPGDGLVHLALAHGLGVASAHRATTDVDTLARLFTRAAELGADLPAMIAHGLRPKARFVALVSFEEKEAAKTAGFQWDASRREWWRTMAIDDAAALPFRTRREDVAA